MKVLPWRKSKSKEEQLKEWLNAIPVRDCEYLIVDEDRVILLLPRSKNPFLKAILNLFNSSPHVKVRLDNRGSFIWQNCDNKRTIQDICNMLIEKFGEEVKPVEERTVMFFKQLYRYGLIKFYKPKAS